MANPVGRHLETIFDEGNPPACQNDNPQRRVLVFEVPIPGDGHEDIRYGEQENRIDKSPLRFLLAFFIVRHDVFQLGLIAKKEISVQQQGHSQPKITARQRFNGHCYNRGGRLDCPLC